MIQANIVEDKENKRTNKNVRRISKILTDAEIDASDEIFERGRYEDIEYVNKNYDHSNTIDYYSEEERHVSLEKEKWLKKQNLIKEKVIGSLKNEEIKRKTFKKSINARE